MEAAEFAAVVRQAVAPAPPTPQREIFWILGAAPLGAALIIVAAGLLGYFAYLPAPRADTGLIRGGRIDDEVPDSRGPTRGAATVAQEKGNSGHAARTSRSRIATANPPSSRALAGRPLMVNFWATWCAPVGAKFPCSIR